MNKTTLRAALVVALGLVPAAARAECSKDTDCKGDRVCSAGSCVAPTVTEPAPAPRHSTGLFAGGLTLAIAGGAAAAVGASMVVLSTNASSEDRAVLQPGGAVVGIAGVLCLAAGIPMAIVGGQRETPARAAALAPWMTDHAGGLAFGGSF